MSNQYQQQPQQNTVVKIQNAVIVTGEYQKDGQTKKRYMVIGALFHYSDGGLSLKLDAMPIGNGTIKFYDKQQQQPRQQQQQQQQSYGEQQQQQQQQSYSEQQSYGGYNG